MRSILRSLLGSEWVRAKYFALRFWYFVHLRKRLRTTNSDDAFKETVAHNLKAVSMWLPRMELLMRPLSVIESVPRNGQVLIIGPRNEYDLILLASLGFQFPRIRGLDLISYSPLIDLGDMHAMSYADNAWDVVLCGWTISYSAEPQKAATEILRVVKPGGFIAIGVEYSTTTEADDLALTGYAIQERDRLPDRVNSVQQILDLFAGHVGTVFFQHDAPLKRSHSPTNDTVPSNVAVIFSVI